MIEYKKLNAEDLKEQAKGIEVEIEEYSEIGSVHLKINGVYGSLVVPTKIDPQKKVNLLLKFDSLNDKVAFNLYDAEVRKQSEKLTEPNKDDHNYIFLEHENVYQVFVKSGVVVYLNEKEVTGLYAVFKEVHKVLQEVALVNK
ncbi:hypothetical protein B4102_2185 [Heyndrickxia sporothermodurans]|uniref:Uncharacterized protein n=1 Tax=Heyndrickxia sporothermodurans TaxID=46224 RepID=A0A150LGK9_9BACI|nr:hypothetical protein [Heyndrickxia sporothermodurans]KYD11457.1 hypothetical protein B4102_2185 [Heyndrickxia sporothermodurans]